MSCALVSVKLVSVELVSIYLMRSYLTDSNLPGIYWDYVVEHAALVNSMITPSITDKSRTIFEHVWGVVPNLDLIPPIGCFAARLMDAREQIGSLIPRTNLEYFSVLHTTEMCMVHKFS